MSDIDYEGLRKAALEVMGLSGSSWYDDSELKGILMLSGSSWYDDSELKGILMLSGVDRDMADADAKFISMLTPEVVLKMLDLINTLGKQSYLGRRRSTNPLVADLMECKGGDAVYAEDPNTYHHHYIENTAKAMREAFDAR